MWLAANTKWPRLLGRFHPWNARGTLHSNTFPEYNYGLILSHETKDLIALPELTLPHPTEIHASILVESEESALVKLKMTLYGFLA